MVHRDRWARRALIAACLSVLAFVAALAPTTADARPAAKAKAKAVPAKQIRKASRQLQRAVTLGGVQSHLKRLQRIGTAFGGNRFAGTGGFDASAQYVYDELKAAGYKPRFDPFEFQSFTENAPTAFQRVSPDPAVFVDGTDFSVLEYSGSGDVTGELEAPSGSPLGCDASDFTGFTAGKVAYVNRGSCTFRIKVTNAAAAGASGIVIANNEPGVLNGTLGADEGEAAIPGVGISQELGTALAAQVAAGPVSVEIAVDATVETTQTRNVIAETAGGDPNNVVFLGAHLDSVNAGPGINDNGSGSAGILEVARQLKKIGTPTNKVRFAWWSAEESGLVGSTDYVSRLTPAQSLKIGLYLNFDMIGSPNYARFIYDGDNSTGEGAVGPPGSDGIEANFEAFFAKQHLATEPTAFDGRSDYGPFIDVGVPSGGLFTGAEEVKTPAQVALYGGTAGEAFDPCYHQACDTYANVNGEVLDVMSDAVADATATYALDTSSVDGRTDPARLKAAPGFGTRRAPYAGADLAR